MKTRERSNVTPTKNPHRVMIVNGTSEVLGLLEAVVDPGHYDVVFIESSSHAYSQIKRLRPNLVILCLRIEDVEGFQVLSMLKLDQDTATIPVLTYSTEYEGQQVESYLNDRADGELVASKISLPRN